MLSVQNYRRAVYGANMEIARGVLTALKPQKPQYNRSVKSIAMNNTKTVSSMQMFTPVLNVPCAAFAIRNNESGKDITRQEWLNTFGEQPPHCELDGEIILLGWNEARGICKALNKQRF